MELINETAKRVTLSLSKQEKFFYMKDMLKQKQYGAYFQFIKILLDAPLSEGGILSCEIDKIWQEHNNNNKTNEEKDNKKTND